MSLLQSLGLPYEMMEMILFKSVVAFYARHRAVSLWPRADVMSLITVGSVCSQWCNIVIGSKRNRWKIHELINNTKVIIMWSIIIVALTN
jgi:hypothetical protein